MPAPPSDTGVVIVGAGPVGLMLATELRLAGAEVTVLERLRQPTTESRASTLHARTMEIFDDRGLLDLVGPAPREPRGHFGGIPLDLTLPGPYPGQWKVPQARIERILQDRALGLGARVLRGHEVRAVRPGAEDVQVTAAAPHGDVHLRAAYLVACDGEDSTVRRLTGVGFPGRPAARRMLRADVDGVRVAQRRFERLPDGLAVAARRPDGVTRVMVHEFGGPAREATFADVAEAWKQVTGEDISGGRPRWVNAFDDTNRQVAAYRCGRVLFAGDAAHRQLPAGGQALNLGLQDAVNLGWKLGAEVAGTAPDGLLDTYHAERHPVGRRVLANVQVQADLLLGGPEVEPLRALVAELVRLPPVREHLAGMISGLDVRYDVGADGPAVLGHRLVPGTAGATPGRDGRGALLHPPGVRVPAHPRVAAVAGGTETLLVRPDGHVVWAGRDGLPEALRRWFGAVGQPRTEARG